MKKLIIALVAIVLFASCSAEYRVKHPHRYHNTCDYVHDNMVGY